MLEVPRGGHTAGTRGFDGWRGLTPPPFLPQFLCGFCAFLGSPSVAYGCVKQQSPAIKQEPILWDEKQVAAWISQANEFDSDMVLPGAGHH